MRLTFQVPKYGKAQELQKQPAASIMAQVGKVYHFHYISEGYS